MKNEQDSITVDDLLQNEMLKMHLTKDYSKALLMRQLTDPTLMGIDLGKVCDMDMEEIASKILLAHTWVQNEQAGILAMIEFEKEQKKQPIVREEISEEQSEGEKLVLLSFDELYTEAYIMLRHPKEGCDPPSEKDISTALKRQHVVRGVKEDYIERLVQHPIYERKIKIAQGKAPISGEDSKITFYFRPVPDFAPPIDENGNADYKSLDFVQNVKKGDLLCEISYATVGESGYSVCDEMLIGTPGRSVNLQSGTNTVFSDDRRKLYAACDGQAYLKGSSVHVARILELESVGTASGNILFVGTVHVKGDVSNGFSVRAGGNIVIDGVAENAVLVAGGNIVISGGMKGMGKDLMVAEGNICTLFMENAHVKAKGSVYADVILNSEVECETCVRLMGQSGKLIGGRLTAGEALLAMELGNNSNMPTWIFLKNPDTFGRTRAQNMLSIAKYKEAIVNLEAAAEFAALSKLDEPAPEVMLCRAIVTKLRLERKITRWEKENEETREQRSKRCYIDVKDSVFPNVIIEIDDVSFKNTVEKPGCYITKVSDKLVFRSNR